MKKVLIAALLSLASATVMADGEMKPMYNGTMSEATSGSRAELTTKDNMIMLYLTSHRAIVKCGVWSRSGGIPV